MADMENCNHVWEYYTTTFDDVFLKCPRCGMVRVAMPWEAAARINKPQRTRPEEDDHDAG